MARIFLRYNRSRKTKADVLLPPVITLGALTLSSASFTNGLAASGTIGGATTGSTIVLAGGPNGFSVNSAARTWSFNGGPAPSSGTLTLTETLASSATVVTSISWSVAAAAPTVVLTAITMSPSPSFTNGVTQTGTFGGTSTGSSLTITGGPSGFTFDSPSRTWSFNGSGSTSSGAFSITETLAGAIGSPKVTSLSWSQSAPAATLATLGLSGSTFVSGTTSGGTITGATSGSTIALANGPGGFTINSAARTWAYDGTATAGSGTLTLTETLAGAFGSPKATNIGWTVTSSATLDSSLSAPFLILTASNADGSAPTIDVALQPDYAVGDTVRIYRRSKAGSLIQTYAHTITLAEATDTSSGTSGKATFGLSAVPAGTWRFTCDVLKAGGATYGPVSNQLTEGPDDQEPTLSLPTQTGISGTSANLGFSTDEAGTYFRVVVPAGTAAPSNTQVVAGQTGTGAAAPFTSTGAAVVGANVFARTGLSASTAYVVYTVVRDPTGNVSAVLSDSFSTISASTQTLLWSTTDKNAALTLTNSNKTATTSGSSPVGLRSGITLPNSKFYIEIVVGKGGANIGSASIGLVNTTESLTTYMGADTGGHVLLFQGTNTPQFFYNNVRSGSTGLLPTFPTVLSLAIDMPNKRMFGRTDGGAWNQVSTDITLVTGIDFSALTGTLKLGFSSDGAGDNVTIRSIAGDMQFAIPTGYSAIDA